MKDSLVRKTKYPHQNYGGQSKHLLKIDMYSFLKECKTGDLLLYSSSNILARTIEYFTSSKFIRYRRSCKFPASFRQKWHPKNF